MRSDHKLTQAFLPHLEQGMRTEEKIAALTREVREHNNFARRMPVVEEQIRVINHMLEGRGQPR